MVGGGGVFLECCQPQVTENLRVAETTQMFTISLNEQFGDSWFQG